MLFEMCRVCHRPYSDHVGHERASEILGAFHSVGLAKVFSITLVGLQLGKPM